MIFKNILHKKFIERLMCSLFLIQAAFISPRAMAQDISNLGYEINGIKYIPTTLSELADATPFIGETTFRKKNVIFLVAFNQECDRLEKWKYSKQKRPYGSYHERHNIGYNLFGAPNGNVFLGKSSGSRVYVTEQFLRYPYKEEFNKCKIKKEELGPSLVKLPQFYIWGKVQQSRRLKYSGELSKRGWGHFWIDIHGISFSGGFSGNVFAASASPILDVVPFARLLKD